MPRWLTTVQIACLVLLLGALGGGLGGLASEGQAGFSTGGALAGGVLVLLALVISRPLLRRSSSLIVPARAQRFIGFLTIFTLAFFVVAALFFFFRLPWLQYLLLVMGGVGVLAAFGGLVLVWAGGFRRDA